MLRVVGAGATFGLAGCVGGSDDGGANTPGSSDVPATETRTERKGTRTDGEGTRSGPDPTAGISVDRGGDGVTVTLVSLSETASGIELTGCADSGVVTQVGESITVDECAGNGTLEVVAVGDDGSRAVVRTIATEATRTTADCSGAGDPEAAVTVDRGPDGPTMTLVSVDGGTESVVVRGCGTEKTLSAVGQSVTIPGCSVGDTLEAVARGCEGETETVLETTVEQADPRTTTAGGSDLSASIFVTQDGNRVTVTAESLGETVGGIDVSGCGSGTVTEEGGSVTVSSCGPGDLLTVTARNSRKRITLLEYRYQTLSDGSAPSAAFTLARGGRRASVLPNRLGDGLKGLRVRGCIETELGDTGQLALSDSCGTEEVITVTAVTGG